MIIARTRKGPLEAVTTTPGFDDPAMTITVTCRSCGLQVSSRTYDVSKVVSVADQMKIDAQEDSKLALEHIERCVGTPSSGKEVPQ